MTKQELRTFYLHKRQSMPEAEYFRLNRQLYDIFFSCVDLSLIRILHTFLPIVERKEPDTWTIIDRIRREFPHIQISIPRVNNQTGSLENFNFEGLHQIRENKWGIPEPLQGIETHDKKIDIVIVPLVCFDKTGHRVGYGKGYYDRFLQNCGTACMKCGISFFDPVDEISDVGTHDVRLNSAITPDQFYQF